MSGRMTAKDTRARHVRGGARPNPDHAEAIAAHATPLGYPGTAIHDRTRAPKMIVARPRSLVMGAYIAFALCVGTLLLVHGLGRINTVVPQRPVYDLVVDWQGARAFVEGFNPYSVEGQARAKLTKTGNGHPPTTPFWMIPLAGFDLPVARQVLLQLNLLLLLIELALIAHELRAPAPWPTAWLGLGLVMSCDWVDYLFYIGQISQLIAFAYFLAWYSLRRGWDVRAGLAIGAACTMKAYPGVMLLLLLLGRRWRSLAAAGALYVVIATIMTIRFGVASWSQYATQLNGVADQWMASIQNQAIHGFVLRFFQPTCRPRGPMVPVATVISTVGAFALLAGAAWLSRRAARTRERIDLPFALAAVLSVFTSNWAWEHYNVIYILPIAIVAGTLPRMVDWPRARIWIAGVGALLLATAATLAVPMMEKARLQAEYLKHPELHPRLHVFEAFNMVPVLALTIALGLLLWTTERRTNAPVAPVAPAS